MIQGDITVQDTEAVVNAANAGLAPGGGVSGAIHSAAGPALWEECRNIGGCNTGEAVISSGYNLIAAHIVHTVGPVYSNSPEDPQLLASCYSNSLKIVLENGIKSVSFPAISTGIFGYPADKAADAALSAVIGFLEEHGAPELVRFVLFDEESFNVHRDTLDRLANE